MKVGLFAFGVLLVCICTTSYADESLELVKIFGDTSGDVLDVITGMASSTGSTTINPNNIFNCGFTPIADTLESGITDLINEASSCDPSKSTDIQNKLTALLNTIPESVSTCLNVSADAQALMTGLKVAGLTQAQVQTQVTNWITDNPLTACFDLQGLYSDIADSNWKQFGSDAGSLIITIFSSSKKKVGASKDHFTQMMTGIVSNIQEAVDVSSIINCSDEPTYANVEANLLPIIDEAASCDPTKFDDISSKATALVNSIPDTQKQCLNQNPEGKKILSGLGIAGLTPDQVNTKITNYVLSHVLTICSTLDGFNKKLKGGDFQGFGTDFGKLALDIFKSSNTKKVAQDVVFALMMSSKFNLKAVDTLADILGGLASVTSAKGADFKNASKCTDEPTSGKILSALADLIKKASTCSLSKATEISQKAKALFDGIPATQKQCFKNDPAAKQLASAFGIAGSSIDKLTQKITAYAIGHFSEVCKAFKVLNSDVTAGKWNQFGVDSGKFLAKIFAAAKLDEEFTELAALKAVDTLADILGGLASVTSAKGADFKTTSKCTDEPTAGNILTTLADLIGKSSTCDLSKATEIAQKAKALVDGIPATHKQCFNNDPAAKQLASAFGITGSSVDKLAQKVIAYAIGHFSEVCNTLKVLNSDVTASNWNQFGVDSGKLLAKIFADVLADLE